MNMKKKAKDLKTKRRVTLSLDIDLDDYFTEVSKELGFKKSLIVEELLKEYLYEMKHHREYSNVVRSLEYRKEQLSSIGKEFE